MFVYVQDYYSVLIYFSFVNCISNGDWRSSNMTAMQISQVVIICPYVTFLYVAGMESSPMIYNCSCYIYVHCLILLGLLFGYYVEEMYRNLYSISPSKNQIFLVEILSVCMICPSFLNLDRGSVYHRPLEDSHHGPNVKFQLLDCINLDDLYKQSHQIF